MKKLFLIAGLILVSGFALAVTVSSELAEKSLIFAKGKFMQVNSSDNAHSMKVFFNGSTPTITTDTGAVTVTNGISGAITGNASTATALAANPADCTSGQFATAIAASGALTCGPVDTNLAITTTFTNGAGASANPVDVTSALGIMNGSDDYTALDVNVTNANHTGSSNTVQGIDIASITGDSEATETAIVIGNGWDTGINAGNNMIQTSGQVLAGSFQSSGNIVSTSTTNVGWSVQSAANQACNTTCTNGCGFGQDAGASNVIVACDAATADVCLCLGAN